MAIFSKAKCRKMNSMPLERLGGSKMAKQNTWPITTVRKDIYYMLSVISLQ
jgi:hypothetical protein